MGRLGKMFNKSIPDAFEVRGAGPSERSMVKASDDNAEKTQEETEGAKPDPFDDLETVRASTFTGDQELGRQLQSLKELKQQLTLAFEKKDYSSLPAIQSQIDQAERARTLYLRSRETFVNLDAGGDGDDAPPVPKDRVGAVGEKLSQVSRQGGIEERPKEPAERQSGKASGRAGSSRAARVRARKTSQRGGAGRSGSVESAAPSTVASAELGAMMAMLTEAQKEELRENLIQQNSGSKPNP